MIIVIYFSVGLVFCLAQEFYFHKKTLEIMSTDKEVSSTYVETLGVRLRRMVANIVVWPAGLSRTIAFNRHNKE